MIARKVMTGASGISITAANHPDLLVMYTAEDISGTTIFDETAASRDGTLANMGTSTGKIGATALDGNGASSKVDFSAPTADVETSMAFTCWVKFKGGNSGESLLSKRDGGNGMQFYFGANNRMDFLHWGLSPSIVTQMSFTTSTGIWYFLACSYDGSDVTIRANATSTTVARTGTLDASGDAFRLFEDWNNNFSNIEMDQMRLFKRGLTSDELDDLYNGGTGA